MAKSGAARARLELSGNLRQPKSLCEGGGRTCTPMMASMGTSVRGMETADGGKKIGCNMPKLHSSGIRDLHPAWHCEEQQKHLNSR